MRRNLRSLAQALSQMCKLIKTRRACAKASKVKGDETKQARIAHHIVSSVIHRLRNSAPARGFGPEPVLRHNRALLFQLTRVAQIKRQAVTCSKEQRGRLRPAEQTFETRFRRALREIRIQRPRRLVSFYLLCERFHQSFRAELRRTIIGVSDAKERGMARPRELFPLRAYHTL